MGRTEPGVCHAFKLRTGLMSHGEQIAVGGSVSIAKPVDIRCCCLSSVRRGARRLGPRCRLTMTASNAQAQPGWTGRPRER